MGGARNYRSATEKALFQLSQRSCYYPSCEVPTLVFVEDHPIINVQIAHIRGAKPGSPRYDPAMTDEERAAFPNLILLCKPHHDVIDRIAPDNYPVDRLQTWKSVREGSISEDLTALAGITEDRLAKLLESTIASLQPRREMEVELLGGILLTSGEAVIGPIGSLDEVLAINPHLDGEPIAVATVRNTGSLPATVEGIDILFGIAFSEGREGDFKLAGRNDFPMINPTLPIRIHIGEGARWLTRLATLEMIIRGMKGVQQNPTEVFVEVALGSGEIIRSAGYDISALPIESGPHTPEE